MPIQAPSTPCSPIPWVNPVPSDDEAPDTDLNNDSDDDWPNQLGLPLRPLPADPPAPDFSLAHVSVEVLSSFFNLLPSLYMALTKGVHLHANVPFCRVPLPQSFTQTQGLLDPFIRKYLREGLIELTARGNSYTHLFAVLKDADNIHVMINLRQLSKHISFDSMYLPAVYQIIPKVYPAPSFFCKVDLSNAFWHFQNRPSSRHLLTLEGMLLNANTHCDHTVQLTVRVRREFSFHKAFIRLECGTGHLQRTFYGHSDGYSALRVSLPVAHRRPFHLQ